MASTYSPKLRFELIGAGEQAGLWGTTTNKNVGQLIEQAIAGVTTVELDGLSGNYTLTALDGAPDQSRSAVVKCTYAAVPASGTVNIIIPTQTKLYVFRNDCGQTITVKTAAQVTGVTLLNGEATLVFCDGTNALAGIATAGVGPTTVANGGTGVTSFTAGFIKSPGGTSALTSSSSVSLTADVSGTLPVGSGGTGVTSFTSGRIVLGNGSGPLTVLSGNNNGDLATWSSALSAWVALPATGGGVTSVSASGSGISASPTTGAVVIQNTGVTSLTGGDGIDASGSTGSVTIDVDSTVARLSNTQTFTGAKTFTGGITSTDYSFNASSSIYLSGGVVNIDISGSNIAKFDDSGGSSRLRLDNSNYGIQSNSSSIGIGYVAGTFFDISGTSPSGIIESTTSDCRKPGGGSWNSTSDQRLKDNVINYTQGLTAIKALRPVNYNYNDVTKLGADTNHKTFTGLIAQEVEQTSLANMVSTGTDGYKVLDASELTYTLINAVKELSAQVDALKAEVAALKGA